MAARLARSPLLIATALTFGTLAALPARAAGSDARLSDIEKQIRSLQAELHRMKSEAAQRDRELSRAQSHAYAAPPPASQPLAITPQIPAGYALVPASPGSATGSVVLARVEQPKPAPIGTFKVGNATVTLGGFIEAASIFRSRNESTDISSNFNTAIPLRYSQAYHETEFHETARQSRISGAVEADPDELTRLRASVIVDFQGGAPTSNYNESNSWVPRLREAFATVDRSDWGFQFLGGQTWTLLTMNKKGVDAYAPNIPLTIDAQYVPGFNWARQPGLRIAKSFAGGQYWLAASIESSATLYSNTSFPSSLNGAATTINTANPGVGIDGTGSNSTTTVVSGVTTTTSGGKTTTTTTTTTVLTPGNITNDIAPDVIVKATADYRLAHLEAYGVGRVFHDRVSQLGNGQSNTQFGGGAGAGAIIHIIPKMLDFQVSGLAGQGIGRYGTSQLPDATIGRHGQPVAVPEWTALAGIVAHPTHNLDAYGYLGTEQVSSRYFNAENSGKLVSYGYGNPGYNNAGCEIELSPASSCAANTSGIVQGTVGFWYKFLQGQYGTMQFGPQYSYTHRSIFQGVGRTPQTDENIVFLSFRYYPFQ